VRHPFAHRVIAYLALLAATAAPIACVRASGPSALQDTSTSATLVSYGSLMRPRCEDADMQLFNGQHEAVCHAYPESIDGIASSGLRKEVPVASGAHHINIRCNYAIIGPNDHGAVPQLTTTIALEVSVDASAKYYIHAEMSNDTCTVSLSQTPPKPPAPLWKTLLKW
jgi:hypothetical protein